MKKWQLALVAAMLIAVAWFAAVKKVQIELPDYGQVPAFEFQDQSGKTFSSAELAGKVWVAGFIFTRCLGPCPMISSKMSELQKRLHYSPHFGLVSFSVDPEYDTAEKLAAYSTNFVHEGKPEWHFLTGERSKIYDLAVKHFKQTASEDPTQTDVQARFMHGTRIVLVDDKGVIRGFYDSSSADVVKVLERDIRSML